MTSKERATCFSVTINNPTDRDEEEIALARQRGWKVDGQLERGKSGTPHYQLIVRTPQVRLSTVTKQFRRGHVEIARNPLALQRYVHKEESREAEMPTSQEMYPSQQMVWNWFGSLPITSQMIHERYCVYARQMRNARIYDPTAPQEMRYAEWRDQYLLDQFDEMMAQKIREGYFCELIAVNPQVRSAVKKFGLAILERSRRQTDRQTERVQSGNILLLPGIINARQESDEEAFDSPSSQDGDF